MHMCYKLWEVYLVQPRDGRRYGTYTISLQCGLIQIDSLGIIYCTALCLQDGIRYTMLNLTIFSLVIIIRIMHCYLALLSFSLKYIFTHKYNF